MKTAMQELIDELERVRSMTNMNFVIRIANDLLEKEKEQIEQTFDNGVYHARYFREDEEQLDGEDYYNQTYNQNK